MRIGSISARGFASFDDFTLDLDPNFTVLIGPNGGGKSNLLRVPDLMLAGLRGAEFADQDAYAELAEALEARHGRRADAGVSLAVDLALTSTAEQELVGGFWQAACCTALLQGYNGSEVDDIAAWVNVEVTTDRLAPLSEGRVILSHAGHRDARWAVDFEFEADGTRYQWSLGSGGASFIARAAEVGPGITLQHHRLAERLLGRGVTHPPSPPSTPFALAAVLPGHAEAIDIAAEQAGYPVPAPLRHFIDAHELDRNAGNRSYTFGATLWTILQRGIVRVSDARLVPERRELAPPNRQASRAEGELPDFLFKLKNGQPAEKARYQDVCELFATLARGRALDVGMRSQDDATAVARVRVTNEFEVPIAYAGSGAWELLVLASTLGYAAATVVVLDEPAHSLHPTLQRVLVVRLGSASGQTVLATHSPYLLPVPQPGKGARIVRLAREGLASRAWVVPSADYTRVFRKLYGKGNLGLPFAERVVLCEGEADVAVVRILADRLGLLLDEDNTVAVDCGGRENLPDYADLSGGLGIQCLILMDRDTSKASVKPEVGAMVRAVEEAATRHADTTTLFGFTEDIEKAFSLRQKNRAALERAAQQVSLEGPGEPAQLALSLRTFLSSSERV
jgi:ABC-type transport system involved in cytochrome c biogenesis ATPase subunit